MNQNEGMMEVQLFSSVDQRTDSKMLPQGKLAELENAVIDKEGETTKMRDANGLAATHSKGENIQHLDGVFIHKGRTIIEGGFQDDDPGATSFRYLRSWGELDLDDGGVNYEDEQHAPLSSVEVDRLDGTDAVVAESGAVGVKNGYTMSCWESLDAGGFSNGLKLIVTRDSDGTEVFRDLLGTTTSEPRITHIDSSNGHLVCMWNRGGAGGMDALLFDTSDESTSTFVVFSSPGHQSFDIVHRPGEDAFDFYYVVTAATSISNRTYDSSGSIITGTTSFVTETIHAPEVQIQVTSRSESSTEQILTWVRDNGGASYDPRWVSITASGTSTISVGTVYSIAAAATAPLITAVHGAGLHGNYYTFMVSRDVNGAVPKHIEFTSVNSANVLQDSLPDLYYAQCSAKPVIVDGTPYWPAVSTVQDHAIGYILTQSQATAAVSQGVAIAGTFLIGTAAPDQFTRSVALRDRTMVFPAVRQANLAADQSGSGVDIFDQPVNVYAEVSGTAKGTITIGDNVYRSGAVTSVFDGGYRPMVGAMEPPNSATLTASTGTGGLSNGIYNWKFVAEYTDADGRRWQSRPSAPLTLNVVAPNDTVDLDDIYMPVGWMGGHFPGLPVRVRLYRTEVDGTVYYDTGKNLPWRWNNSPVMSFTDTISDNNLISNPLLYSEGGIENAPPPPSRDIAFANGRIWIVSSDDENVIKVTKSIIDGEGIHFADELTLETSGEGKIMALQEMDGNMIILRRSSIYSVIAQAPNDAGVGAFGSPRLITSEIGCVSSQSAVRTDEGIMFQSDRGIYLLTRSLSVVPVGVPVEDFSKGDWKIFKSAVKTAEHEVWFLARDTNAGDRFRWLVWNTLYKRWSYSAQRGPNVGKQVDFVFRSDRYVACSNDTVAESTSHVLYEFEDAYTGQVTTVTTPWISFSQARQALQRIKRLYLFGEWRSSTTITIEVYKDWDETTVAQTITFAATSGYTAGDPLRFRGHLSVQKAEALKFKIYDTTTGSGEGVRFSTLALRYQTKRSGFKLPGSLSV